MRAGPYVSFGALAFAVLLFSTGSNFTSERLTLVAASSGAAEGSCETAYKECLGDALPDKSYCEYEWKSCVQLKCRKVTVGKDGSMRCNADRDCQTSCTEVVSSKKGVTNCCEGGPQHDNKCPNKIDNYCKDSFEPPKEFRGDQYSEGDVIFGDDNASHAYSKWFPSPMYPLKYPEGSVFDDQGNAFQDPTPLPNTLFNTPEHKVQPAFIVGSVIPDEYKPDFFDMHEIGKKIQSIAEEIKSQSKSTPPDMPIPTVTKGNTFEYQEPEQPKPNTCSFKFWGWCFW